MPAGSGVRAKSRLATYSSRVARDAGREVRLGGNRDRLRSSGAPMQRALTLWSMIDYLRAAWPAMRERA